VVGVGEVVEGWCEMKLFIASFFLSLYLAVLLILALDMSLKIHNIESMLRAGTDSCVQGVK